MSIKNGYFDQSIERNEYNQWRFAEINEWSHAVYKFARCSRDNSPFQWKKYASFTIR